MMDLFVKDREKTFLFLIFFIAILFRVVNLHEIPHWYWDEGVNMNYGWHLSEGRIQWFSLKYSFIPHPPTYLLLTALVIKTVGYSLYLMRFINVLFSLLTLFLVYLIAREVSDKKTGLLSALLFAIYPAGIYWGRQVMINNLFSLLFILSLYLFLVYLRLGGRWWLYSTIVAIFASLTSFTGFVLFIPLLIHFFSKKPGYLPFLIIVSTIPFIAFFLVMIYIRGTYFLEDLFFQLDRFHFLGYKTMILLPLLVISCLYRDRIKSFFSNMFENEVELLFTSKDEFIDIFVPSCLLGVHLVLCYKLIIPFSDLSLFSGGDYFWIGIVGLLFVKRLRVYLVLLYFFPLFVATIFLGRSDHMLIGLYPFFIVGTAIFLFFLKDFIFRLKMFSSHRIMVVSVILVLPFAFTLYYDLNAFVFGGILRAEDVSSNLAVVGFVNDLAGEDELILTTSNLVGLLDSRSSILTQSFVYDGYGIAYYRSNLSSDWFVDNISLDNAAYVIVPSNIMPWINEAGLGVYTQKMQDWTIVYDSGGYLVFDNPLSDD